MTAIKIVGLGGVGSIVARYLCLFLASIDRELRVVLIDGDSFEMANAARMFFSSCGNKAAVVRNELLQHLAHSKVSILAIEEHIAPSNILQLLHNGDIIILAVDNHATRKLVSDFVASKLADACLISGGNDGIEDGRRGTYGNVQIYVRRGGVDITPSLTRYHPEIDKPEDRLPTGQGCTALSASIPQILFTNLTTASCVLNTFWLHVCGGLTYPELAFDIADAIMSPVELPDVDPTASKAISAAKVEQPEEGDAATALRDANAHLTSSG